MKTSLKMINAVNSILYNFSLDQFENLRIFNTSTQILREINFVQFEVLKIAI